MITWGRVTICRMLLSRIYPRKPKPSRAYTQTVTQMVQYWQVLNLDKRQTLGQESWGEMKDIMMSGTPEALVDQLRAGKSGSWARDRIVIVSDYALTYPEGMLTPGERDEVEDMYLEGEEGEYDDDDPAPTLYAFAEEWYKAVPVAFGEAGAGVEYLRNATKKEYVRSDAVAKVVPADVKARGAGGLGHAVIVLASWTSEAEYVGSEAVGTGSWAGDRFEIGGDVGHGWTDISERVAQHLSHIWDSLSSVS